MHISNNTQGYQLLKEKDEKKYLKLTIKEWEDLSKHLIKEDT